MRRLINNKKGGIPVISEIVTFFVGVVPKPILFMMFVLLISVLASFVLPMAFNMFGYDCVKENGKLELYQVPMNNFLLAQKNLFDLKETIRGWFGLEDYRYPENPFLNGDKTYLRVPDKCIVETNVINGTIGSQSISGYTSLCVNCTASTQPFLGIFVLDKNSVCTSSGYYKTLTGGSLNEFTEWCYQCAPPNPYYFNISACQDITNCYFTITNTTYIPSVPDDYEETFYLENIKKLGGIKKVQDTNQVFNIHCKASNTPALYFFSIDIFQPTLWLILGFGMALVTFAYAYYSQILGR